MLDLPVSFSSNSLGLWEAEESAEEQQPTWVQVGGKGEGGEV